MMLQITILKLQGEFFKEIVSGKLHHFKEGSFSQFQNNLMFP